ncbi:hypothetical protein WR25_02813 isoform D [Diploscapter pachys]|uniref:Uncharacterized protein n=1 Tax=Diploscapter pachys TaxID=2018661 RepID=A0A2A2LY03_9BILA|nr:hypothetical protein WR25_02813 isoform B [Diploscapter pachys]PAV91114.1 hypothetical protein WR25_02813 isoform D [Diploscapter pachys]
MQYPTLVCLFVCLVALFAAAYGQDDDSYNMDKRAMRNALVRFGRATGMRNALVRFGKRSSPDAEEFGQTLQDKRNAGVPQPFDYDLTRHGGALASRKNFLSPWCCN